MTGISYKVTIEDTELKQRLSSLTERMDDLAPFHKNVGEHLLNSVEDRFENESTPDGSKWQAHAPSTVRSRLKRNGNAPLTILRERGHLSGSFNYEADSQHVKVGSSLVYAAIHHFGGKAGKGHSATIPSRPILGLSSGDEEVILQMAEDFLQE